MKVGKVIRQTRESKGWSKEQLSQEIQLRFAKDISPRTIHQFEQGQNGTLAVSALILSALHGKDNILDITDILDE